MNKKIMYSLLTLAIIFFIGSLIVFLKTTLHSGKDNEDALVVNQNNGNEAKENEWIDVRVFYLVEESEQMEPLPFRLQVPHVRLDLYKNYVDLLLKGSGRPEYIAPVPEGVTLRTLFFMEKRQLLILDFNEQLVNQFPGGTATELEFIYYIVDNICDNFSEIKAVKFLIAGNEYSVLSGHLDIESPFTPDFRKLRKNE